MNQEQLAALAAGRLPAERFGRLLEHLDGCPECQRRAEAMDLAGDSVVGALRHAGRSDPHAAEPDCLALLRAGVRPDGLESPAASPPVEQLGPYRLIRPLGCGGMGAVYLADHRRLRRRCAVKLLPRERCRDVTWRDRFEREMAAVAALADPHIVAATDAGEVDGWHYLVMEYLDGLDLSRLAVRMGTLEVAEACELIRQAAVGLSHIHDAALVHRDIKPSNLMLTRDGTVKILDLGLVLSGTDPLPADDRLTTVGQLIGTVAYMAPEQLADCTAVDRRADLYALGATLFRLLAGVPPFGASRGIAPLIVAKCGRDAPQLVEYRRDVPEQLNELVAGMLDREPSRRPQSAEAIVRALEPHAADARPRRLIAAAMRKGPAVEETSSLAPPRPLPSPVLPPRRPWSRRAAAAAALPLFLLAGIVITLATDRGKLVIESETEGVVVSIRRDDQEVKKMELETGDNRIALRSGTYTISVEGPADTLRLSDDEATVTRGGETVLRVRHLESPDPAQPTDAVVTAAATQAGSDAGPFEPTYRGETLSRWLMILESDRDVDKIVEAMEAVAAIAGFEQVNDQKHRIEPAQRRRAAESMLVLSRRLGGIAAGNSNASQKFMEGLLKSYPALMPSPGLEAIAAELDFAAERSTIASIWLLQEYLADPNRRTHRAYEPPPGGLQAWTESEAGRQRLERMIRRIDQYVMTQGGYMVKVQSTARAEPKPPPRLAVSKHVAVNLAYPVRLSLNRILERSSLDDPRVGPRLRMSLAEAEARCRAVLSPKEDKPESTRLPLTSLTFEELDAVLAEPTVDGLPWAVVPTIYRLRELSQERRLEVQKQLAAQDPEATADALLAVFIRGVAGTGGYRGRGRYSGDMDYGEEYGFAPDYGMEGGAGFGDLGSYDGGSYGGGSYGGGSYESGFGLPAVANTGPLLEHALEIIAESTTQPQTALKFLQDRNRFPGDAASAAVAKLKARIERDREEAVNDNK